MIDLNKSRFVILRRSDSAFGCVATDDLDDVVLLARLKREHAGVDFEVIARFPFGELNERREDTETFLKMLKFDEGLDGDLSVEAVIENAILQGYLAGRREREVVRFRVFNGGRRPKGGR